MEGENAIQEEGRMNAASFMNFLGFWLSGLLNNSSYVIMIAGAKDLDSSMVGLIFFCGVAPSFMVKLTGPYWFHNFSYRTRVVMCSLIMVASFMMVGLGHKRDNIGAILTGVSLASAQSGLGEASFLALCSYFDPPSTSLTAWSSGTGFAGIFGYAWVVFFTYGLDAYFSTTAFVACAVLPLGFWLNFELVLKSPRPEETRETLGDGVVSGMGVPTRSPLSVAGWGVSEGDDDDGVSDGDGPIEKKSSCVPGSVGKKNGNDDVESPKRMQISPALAARGASRGSVDTKVAAVQKAAMSKTTSTLTMRQRLDLTCRLWPYMVPLAVVYFAEYALQSGVWAAMGFPVESQEARQQFYEFSNWTYQVGVVIARSSGKLWTPTRLRLWLIPGVQVIFLAFSIVNAYYELWYDWSILTLCFCVGLCGGAVYVGGFTLITIEMEESVRELSLSTASIADSVGIMGANIAGIFIQRSLYSHLGLSDNDQ